MLRFSIFLIPLFGVIIGSCNKSVDAEKEEAAMSLPTNAIDTEKEIGLTLLGTTKNVDIRSEIMAKAIANAEKTDYYVTINELASATSVDQNTSLARSVSASNMKAVLTLNRHLSDIKNGNNPVVFYPRSEVIEYRLNRAKNKNLALSYQNNKIQTSIKNISIDEIEEALNTSNTKARSVSNNNSQSIEIQNLVYDATDPEDPGYLVDPSMYGQVGYPVPPRNGALMFVPASSYDPSTELAEAYIIDETGNELISIGKVSEEYAWEHDVIVIGAEDANLERFDFNSEPNSYSFITSEIPLQGRANGEAEYGGIIQITDLGNVESWIAGKVELGYIVIGQGGVALKNREFGKHRRKNFKNEKWMDFNDFIANWDTATIGKVMVENWIEYDDGGEGTVNSTVVIPPACEGCPSSTVNYSFEKSDNDKDLGKSIVQFRDNKSQVYNITDANFKRK